MLPYTTLLTETYCVNLTSLLGFDKYRCRQRTWSNTCESLYSNCVYNMRRKLTDCRQLIVVHHLWLPRSHCQCWIHSIVNFVTLNMERKYSQKIKQNKDGGHKHLQNISNHLQNYITQRTRSKFFTVMKTSNLKRDKYTFSTKQILTH
jgi:hypothetical protein